eukprot:scaffold683_cov334-Pavlova_lutheri.AAC.1
MQRVQAARDEEEHLGHAEEQLRALDAAVDVLSSLDSRLRGRIPANFAQLERLRDLLRERHALSGRHSGSNGLRRRHRRGAGTERAGPAARRHEAAATDLARVLGRGRHLDDKVKNADVQVLLRAARRVKPARHVGIVGDQRQADEHCGRADLSLMPIR